MSLKIANKKPKSLKPVSFKLEGAIPGRVVTRFPPEVGLITQH